MPLKCFLIGLTAVVSLGCSSTSFAQNQHGSPSGAEHRSPTTDVGKNSEPSVSPDDTVAYINRVLAENPTSDYVATHSAGSEYLITISPDRKFILVHQSALNSPHVHRDAGTYAVPTQNLSMAATPGQEEWNRAQGYIGETGTWHREGESQLFPFLCSSGSCISKKTGSDAGSLSRETYVTMTASEEASRRLARAMFHLVISLESEADRKLKPDDPFAK